MNSTIYNDDILRYETTTPMEAYSAPAVSQATPRPISRPISLSPEVYLADTKKLPAIKAKKRSRIGEWLPLLVAFLAFLFAVVITFLSVAAMAR